MHRKTKIFIISICALVVAVIIGIVAFQNRIMTYSSAKKECIKVLEQYQAEMEELAIYAMKAPLTASNHTSGEYRSFSYTFYKDTDYVKFLIDAQGMLGGQYWELIYTKSGKLYGENENYYYKEDNGNNIIKAEKLNNNWYYCWVDYDGTEYSNR